MDIRDQLWTVLFSIILSVPEWNRKEWVTMIVLAGLWLNFFHMVYILISCVWVNFKLKQSIIWFSVIERLASYLQDDLPLQVKEPTLVFWLSILTTVDNKFNLHKRHIHCPVDVGRLYQYLLHTLMCLVINLKLANWNQTLINKSVI